jgi:hypothetical protein
VLLKPARHQRLATHVAAAGTNLKSVLNTQSTTNDVIAGHDLTGRNAIVTGGTAGLGYETGIRQSRIHAA